MTSSDTPASDRPTLEGQRYELTDEVQRRSAIELAFDFRGDVVLHRADGSTIVGYIFDRRPDADPPTIRLIARDDGQRLTVPNRQIVAIEFGKDTAAGKSWETWVRNYHEKKARGEQASIEAEPLE